MKITLLTMALWLLVSDRHRKRKRDREKEKS